MTNEDLQTLPAISRPETKPLVPSTNELTQTFGVTPGILETMFERAYRFPRDLNKVKDSSLLELEIVPELAARSYYSIPYNQGKANETRVEGPSVKTAMTLVRNFGWCLIGDAHVGEDKNNVIVSGMVYDYQTGNWQMATWRVPRFYKPARGQGVIPKPFDLLQTHIMAGKAKAKRNAIINTIPDWLVHLYYNRAKELVLHPPKTQLKATKSIQERILDGKSAISKQFNVTMEQLDTYIAENAEHFQEDGELLVHLQGLYNSLRDGDADVLDVLTGKEEKTGPAMPEEKKQ